MSLRRATTADKVKRKIEVYIFPVVGAIITLAMVLSAVHRVNEAYDDYLDTCLHGSLEIQLMYCIGPVSDSGWESSSMFTRLLEDEYFNTFSILSILNVATILSIYRLERRSGKP